MKRIAFISLLLICTMMTEAADGLRQNRDGLLELNATASAMGIDGKSKGASLDSLYILGGELSNSAATSIEDIDEVIPRMAALGLNTLLVPAYWEFIEPEEGQFDFTLIDRVLQRARENQLKIVFLWFGAWKNSMSCYAPVWFKRDTKRFPRVETRMGKPLEIASCFSDNVLQADLRAFSKFMQHLADKDKGIGTVVMMQIENEIGMLEDARDYSPLAQKVYEKEQWAKRYGTDVYADEKFMALHYAQYVEHLAKAARSIYPMPLYVNAAMNSRGRKPGEYPSAGPLAHLMEFWHQGAPSIDLLAPDIYDTGYKSWASQYATADNRLFVPESRCCVNSGVRALYTMGEHQALGFSPFAIDQAPETDTWHVTQAYTLLNQLKPYLRSTKPYKTWGLLFDQEDKERVIEDGDRVLTCRHAFTLPWDPRATDGSTWPEVGGVVIKLSADEYLLAGNGIVVEFATKNEQQYQQRKALGEDGFVQAGQSGSQNGDSKEAKSSAQRFSGKRLGIASIDQISIGADGAFHFIRRDNGDQSHQGRHARISVGEYKILHVKLYQY
ncbi:MAG: DUF5597 domain-containing protein [Prevotella sp.]|nr:DUF5597 domain-containing protein [Prevotella sp.]